MKKTLVISAIILAILIYWFLPSEEVATDESEYVLSNHDLQEERLSSQVSIEEQRQREIKQREIEMKIGVEKANVPINFWGKVVDLEGVPIEGAKITYRVQQPRVMWDSHSTISFVNSEADGSFYIKEKGSSFGVKDITKEGYKIVRGQRLSFTYSESSEKYVPNSTKPRIYTMIREDKLPRLVSFSKQLLLDWDGQPIHYDLNNGRFGKNGHIKIIANRGKAYGVGQAARYNWSFKLEVPDGGILESSREEAFYAPKEGYLPLWEYGFKVNDQKWQHRKSGDTFFFIRLPNGNYGRIKIRFSAEPGSRLSGRIYSYLNPSGGRVLEKN